jgi:hypothetical protein
MLINCVAYQDGKKLPCRLKNLNGGPVGADAKLTQAAELDYQA